MQKFDPADPASAADILAEDAVFHFFNPELPEVQGDYIGPEGFQDFFGKMGALTRGTFKVSPVFATPVGDELVIVRTKNTMVIGDRQIETDVVVVWRIIGGKIKEVWDIPSVYTAKTIELSPHA